MVQYVLQHYNQQKQPGLKLQYVQKKCFDRAQ